MGQADASAVADDEPVKITVDLRANVHRDLAVYADLLACQTGLSIPDPAKLVAPMLARFMAPIEFLRNRAARVSPQQGKGQRSLNSLRKFASPLLSLSLRQWAKW